MDNFLVDKCNLRKKIPKNIKRLFAKRTRLSKRIMKARNGLKISEMKAEIEDIETKIKESKEKVRLNEEQKAIEEIKTNPKAFYKFAKKKSVIKTKVGPFVINGETISDEKRMANILSKQYELICSHTLENISSNEFIQKLMMDNDMNSAAPKMDKVEFSYESTKKIITKLSHNAAMEPD